MALLPLSMIVVIATIFLPSISMAKEFVVGDDRGWTTGVDYTAWAADNTFLVEDILVFEYAVGTDNVLKVNGTAFQSCRIPAEGEVWNSGHDRVVLATPGRNWYMSGYYGNCNAGQRLLVTVQPQTLPSTPAPAPSPLQHGPHSGGWVPTKLFTIFH